MHYHHTGRQALQYSTRTLYGLLPPLNVSLELGFPSGPEGTAATSLLGEAQRCRCGWGWGVRRRPLVRGGLRAPVVAGPLQFSSAREEEGAGGASGMDLEGQQLLRVHVVEGAQVGQLQQQLGEDGRLVGVVPGDEAAQGADQRLLEGLHRVHVLDARAV